MDFTGYADVAYADEYLSLRLDTFVWDNGVEQDKKAALQMASDDLDNLPLRGQKKTNEQDRRFPRDFQSDDQIPEAVKKACVELALAYLKGVDSHEEYSLLTRREMVYSSLREQRDTTQVEPHIVAGIPSLRAFNLMVPYLRDERSGRLVRKS